MNKREFLAKLKQYDVGDDFKKKSANIVEQLFDNSISEKNRKKGMDVVLKVYKDQAEFRKKIEGLKGSIKKIEQKNKNKVK